MDEIAWRTRRQVDDLGYVFYHPDNLLHNRFRNPSEASALILVIQSARLLAEASLSSDPDAVLAALIHCSSSAFHSSSFAVRSSVTIPPVALSILLRRSDVAVRSLVRSWGSILDECSARSWTVSMLSVSSRCASRGSKIYPPSSINRRLRYFLHLRNA